MLYHLQDIKDRQSGLLNIAKCLIKIYKIRNTFDDKTNYIYFLLTNPVLQKGLEGKLQHEEVTTPKNNNNTSNK